MSHLLTTPLHEWHLSHGGRMVEFGGWEMPVQYSSIMAEHLAVRHSAGLFDISHMGRLRFTGPQACTFVDYLTTIDVLALQPGQIKYALLTREDGGILDDVLVYRFPEAYGLVVNAGNRLKILDWIARHRAGFEVHVEDLTMEQAMLAWQGPRAQETLQRLIGFDLQQLRYYNSVQTTVGQFPLIVTRSGYTGEDGFELMLPRAESVSLWDRLLQVGDAVGAVPCGLGCRDTLRLESAMPLYGHELSEEIDPYTAGLAFAVKLEKGNFVGQAALRQRQKFPGVVQRVGLQLESRRIAREGAAVFQGTQRIGHVTSGTFSPTLQRSIGMAYLLREQGQPGTNVEVEIRGTREPAEVVSLPFYRRDKSAPHSAAVT